MLMVVLLRGPPEWGLGADRPRPAGARVNGVHRDPERKEIARAAIFVRADISSVVPGGNPLTISATERT